MIKQVEDPKTFEGWDVFVECFPTGVDKRFTNALGNLFTRLMEVGDVEVFCPDEYKSNKRKHIIHNNICFGVDNWGNGHSELFIYYKKVI